MEDAQELLELTQQNVDWTEVQKEVIKEGKTCLKNNLKWNFEYPRFFFMQIEEFSVINGNRPLSFNEWQQLIQVSEDIRRDLLEKGSIKKVIG